MVGNTNEIGFQTYKIPFVSLCNDLNCLQILARVQFDIQNGHANVLYNVIYLFNFSDSDIDVANTLMSLKRAAESRRPHKSTGARSRSPSPPEFGSKREKELLKQNLR